MMMSDLVYKDGQLYWKRDMQFPAGQVTETGYIRIVVNRKNIFAHRIVWEMFNGSLLEGDKVFHKNGDKSDNRIENLTIEKTARKDSTSKVPGVNFYKKTQKWAAIGRKDKKTFCLGYFLRVEDAIAARKAWENAS